MQYFLFLLFYLLLCLKAVYVSGYYNYSGLLTGSNFAVSTSFEIQNTPLLYTSSTGTILVLYLGTNTYLNGKLFNVDGTYEVTIDSIDKGNAYSYSSVTSSFISTGAILFIWSDSCYN